MEVRKCFRNAKSLLLRPGQTKSEAVLLSLLVHHSCTNRALLMHQSCITYAPLMHRSCMHHSCTTYASLVHHSCLIQQLMHIGIKKYIVNNTCSICCYIHVLLHSCVQNTHALLHTAKPSKCKLYL